MNIFYYKQEKTWPTLFWIHTVGRKRERVGKSEINPWWKCSVKFSFFYFVVLLLRLGYDIKWDLFSLKWWLHKNVFLSGNLKRKIILSECLYQPWLFNTCEEWVQRSTLQCFFHLFTTKTWHWLSLFSNSNYKTLFKFLFITSIWWQRSRDKAGFGSLVFPGQKQQLQSANTLKETSKRF